MKRFLSIFLALLMLCSFGTAAIAEDEPEQKPVVQLSSQNLTVDGNPINCDKYNIDGSNYFKLRDLACVLNGTGSSFSVGYDSESRTITLTAGEEYLPNGSELKPGEDLSASAVRSNQTVCVNGEPVSFTAYNIGGNNYFKLRELGEALGFEVGYREDTKTATVKSEPLDPKQDAVMRSQWGNLMKCGAAVQSEDSVYYMARLLNCDPVRFVLIERKDSGELRTVMESEERFENLFLREDGYLYVLNGFGTEKSILKIDPETGAYETYYTAQSGRIIDSFFFYDDTLFFVDQTNEVNVTSWTYRLMSRDEKGKLKTLDNFKYAETTYLSESFYAYDGTLYYVGGDGIHYNYGTEAAYDALYAYDLESGKKTLLFSQKNPDEYDFGFGKMAYIGHYAYNVAYAAEEGGDYSLVRIDLRNPEDVTLVAAMSGELTKSYQNLYANGSQLYFQSSGAKKLWSVSQTGEFTVMTESPTSYYEGSMVNRQAVIDAPKDYFNFLINKDIVVILPDGTVTDYEAFLNIG